MTKLMEKAGGWSESGWERVEEPMRKPIWNGDDLDSRYDFISSQMPTIK